MKIVFASTPDQEQQIKELVHKFYTDVFPLYFSDEDIREFEQLKVLHTSTRHFEYFGTLREAYQVIAALQTIKAILESCHADKNYEAIYGKNVKILKEFGLSFPFRFSQFCGSRNLKENMFSIYTKAANELLV